MSSAEQPVSSATRQIARAAGTVMIAFILSNLAGLLRGILVYRAFGASADLDSFNAANRLTEVLYNLMAGGALGSAFIPTFTAFLAREDRPGAWRLASAVANLLVITLSLISLVMAIFAPQVVRYGLFILSPGSDLGQEALTIHLLRLLLPTVVIFGLSGLAMGILNAHQVFLIPAAAPAMYSLGMILGVLFLPAGWGIDRLAWGALGGALLHLLVQTPGLLRLPGRAYRPLLGLKVPAVREVGRLIGPRIFGVAVVQLNFVINTIIALSLPEGSVSAVSLAFTWMLMPQAAIAQSIAIAAMPTFSAQVAKGELEQMRVSLAAALRAALLLAAPASVGLILLRTPLIRLLYEGGAFTAHSTALVAWALLWYAAGLVGHSLVEIISRAFYALHDTRTPVLLVVASMLLNLVLSLLFSSWFARLGWMPHGGLALANTLATSLEAVGLLVFMRRRLNGLDSARIARAAGAALLAVTVMGAALTGWLTYSTGWADLWIVLGGLIGGMLVYLLIVAALRVPELFLLLRAVKRRFPRGLA